MAVSVSAHTVDLSFLNNININIEPQFDNGNTNTKNGLSKVVEGLNEIAEEFLGDQAEASRPHPHPHPHPHPKKHLCKLAKKACIEDKKVCEEALEDCPGIKKCEESKEKCMGAIKRCKEDKEACGRAKEICMGTKKTCMAVIKDCKECWKPCGAAKAKCTAAEKICRKRSFFDYMKEYMPQRDAPRRAGNPLVLPTTQEA